MSIDTQIRALFDKLAARKAKVEELKTTIAKSWKTNGTFRLFGATSTTNIQTATIGIIAEAATQVELYTAAASTSAKKLGIEDQSQQVQGYTVQDWYADFMKRIAAISLREEENALAKLEERLNQVLSPEERRRIEVELLMKEI